jgi:molybdopterin molybdotransferase
MAEPFPPEGLPLAEARRRVLSSLKPLAGRETVTLLAGLDRVAAVAVRASAAVPGFPAAILDGYAVSDELPPAVGRQWSVVGRSAPGLPCLDTLQPEQAIRILTGAPLPPGAARVLAQELVRREAEVIQLIAEAGPARWIRPADEEGAQGDLLLPAGHRLGPADLGRLAGCGVERLEVVKRPRLGLLVSGDELVAPGCQRAFGQIWESNGTLLGALLLRLGYPVAATRWEPDEPRRLGQALDDLASVSDVVVTTGGVSAGDSDWIRPLLAERGRVDFWKLFLRPGRPFAFGHLGAAVPLFGLPGNPVAAAITALELLWPALQHLEGAEPEVPLRLRVTLADRCERRPGRPELARARLEVDGEGLPLARLEGSQASSRIGSLQGADLLLEIPAAAATLEPGIQLWAQLLRRSLF